LDRATGSVEKEKEAQSLFFFSAKKRSSVKDLAEVLQDILVLSRELWRHIAARNFLKEATGVQLNWCAALWVCS
jgi:hypothetical protein